MSTPKTAQFKLRQAEFRELNKKLSGYSIGKGNWNANTGLPTLQTIKYPFVVKDE